MMPLEQLARQLAPLLPALLKLPPSQLLSSPCCRQLQTLLAQGVEPVPFEAGVEMDGLDLRMGRARLSVYQMGRGLCMPLHDHPGMHVFQKIIRGQFVVRRYSVVHGLESQLHPFMGRGQAVLTCRLQEVRMQAGEQAVVDPVDNLHEITALEDGSQFLDVFVPDYEERQGATCINGFDQEDLGGGMFRMRTKAFSF
jgi:hypothetical protein